MSSTSRGGSFNSSVPLNIRSLGLGFSWIQTANRWCPVPGTPSQIVVGDVAPAAVASSAVSLAHAASRTGTSTESRPSKLSSMKIVSFNVWFDAFAQAQRNAALIEELQRIDPDLVGLQEVTPSSLQRLLQDPWIREQFILTDDESAKTVRPYGVLILIRKNHSLGIPSAVFDVELPTKMARRALVAQFAAGFSFCTVHLESLNSRSVRVKQLEIIGRVLSPIPDAVVVGDMNFDDPNPSLPFFQESVDVLGPGFLDAWPLVHGSESVGRGPNGSESKTFDMSRNPMFRSSGGFQARYDRVVAKLSEGRGGSLSSVRLVGTESQGIMTTTGEFTKKFEPYLTDSTTGNRHVAISDHFGLAATIIYI